MEIDALAADKLNSFSEAGLPGSVHDRRTRREISRLSSGRFQAALLERLRLHQNFHNRHVLARSSPRHRVA